MLKFFAVEKNAALLLVIFALTGLVLANGPMASSFSQFADTPMRWFDSFSLSPSEVSGEFLMTGFFLLVGLELKRELTSGVFRQRSALLIPILAAFFGAVVPALVYFTLNANNPETSRGWGIPMATDLTFALAVFSIFGKKIPAQGRIFVLAFAVIDDLIAIAVIAIFVSEAINLGWALATLAALLIFWLAGRVRFYWLMPLLAVLAWCLLSLSGVQPAVVGVLLGLLVPAKKVAALEVKVHPWISLLILPIFALFATAVNLGGGFSLLAPVALAVLLRPIG
ncbi:MAG: Na+/H+ antiporter NhaA, partial [Actinomycetes bacterium]